MRLIRLAAVLSVLVIARGAAAQSATSGTIAGAVRDATSAVLPGVTVEAASPALIEKVRTVVTDGNGEYKIVDLRPGTYAVTFSLTGFSAVRREGLVLTTGFTATIDAEMKVGSLEETVTVSGASPVVDVQNVRTQNVMSRERLDAIPTGKTIGGYTALTLGATQSGSHDVGGNKGEITSGLVIHGSSVNDGRLLLDGMPYNMSAGIMSGFHRFYMVSQAVSQEIVLETGGISSESETGGVQLNAVPREGSNRFAYYFNTSYTNNHLQSGNVSDELRARGLVLAPKSRKIYDIGGGVGGPIRQDKLWFYTAHRWWGADEFAAGNFFNATLHTLFYTPDVSRPAYRSIWNEDHSVRFTWQAASKHKVTIFESIQHNCTCFMTIEGNRAPEATNFVDFWPIVLTQGTWTYAATNRLLIQAGVTHGFNQENNNRVPDSLSTDIGVLEQSTGYQYGARVGLGLADYGTLLGHQANERFVVSYVTGSHAFKTGVYNYNGWAGQHIIMNDPPVQYVLRKATPTSVPLPVSVTYYAAPLEARYRSFNLGAYAQDQWTVNRLTLNLGVRFDHLHSWNPPQRKPDGTFVAGFDTPEIDDVPNWKDVSPRLGAAYDFAGDGRTAVKASLGRFIQSDSTFYAQQTNPQASIATTASRIWNDANGDYVPQESELGPLSNSAFGTPVINTTYSPEVLTGWYARPYTWEGSVAVQHELRPGIGVGFGYFRTWFGNFMATDNLRVTAADTDPYCVTAPTDARLPGGGGNQLCELADIKPASFGLVQNVVVPASDFGSQKNVYNGFDLSTNARFSNGAMLGGGLNTGKTVTDNCDQIVDTKQKRFCHVTNPWHGQTQIKLNGVYPLPGGLQVSGVFQNLPGPQILSNTTFTNAQVAPSLGRNLGQCRGAAVCNGTVSVAVIEPGTEFENRLTQLDLRLTKAFRIKASRLQGMFDVYNIFNANTILTRNNTYGATWGLPQTILAGRLVKFGAQLDF